MTPDFRMPMLSKWCVPRTWLLRLAVQLTMSASAAAQSVPAVTTQPALMDGQREIALALSACPVFVADNAAVYVLEKSGYVKVRESQNGFTAIVQHSVPTAQEPRCMDAQGTRTHLPRIVKVAELRAQGKSRERRSSYPRSANIRRHWARITGRQTLSAH